MSSSPPASEFDGSASAPRSADPLHTWSDKLARAQTPREVFEHALAAVLAQVNPERALLAHLDNGDAGPDLVALASHGFDPQTVFVSGDISTELLKTVMRDGQSQCLVDAINSPGLANRTSVILSGLRSILCVPVLNAAGKAEGLIYVDNRIKAGAFDARHQSWLEEAARRVEARLQALAREQPAAPAMGTSSPTSEADWAQARSTAFTLFREARLPEALSHLRQAVELAGQFGAHDPRLGKSLGELAELERQSGDLEAAEHHFIRAVDVLERGGSECRPELAPVLNNLATFYFAAGNGLRAEGLYRRALELWSDTLPKDDRRFAPLLYNLGTLRRSAGAEEEARALFGRALKIAETAWGPDHAHSQRCRAALAEGADHAEL